MHVRAKNEMDFVHICIGVFYLALNGALQNNFLSNGHSKSMFHNFKQFFILCNELVSPELNPSISKAITSATCIKLQVPWAQKSLCFGMSCSCFGIVESYAAWTQISKYCKNIYLQYNVARKLSVNWLKFKKVERHIYLAFYLSYLFEIFVELYGISLPFRSSKKSNIVLSNLDIVEPSFSWLFF